MTEKKLTGYYFVPAFEESPERAQEPEASTLPRMVTIQQLTKECRGTGITESAIRTLLLEGRIAHVKIGRKYLVNYDRFIEFLNTPPKPEGPPQGVIRRIPENLKREDLG